MCNIRGIKRKKATQKALEKMSSLVLLVRSPVMSSQTGQVHHQSRSLVQSGPKPHAPCMPRRRQAAAGCVLGMLFCFLPKTMHLKCMWGKQIAAPDSPGPLPQLCLPQHGALLCAPSPIQMAADAAVKAAPGRQLPGQLCIWLTREPGRCSWSGGLTKTASRQPPMQACFILSPARGIAHVASDVC